MKESPPEHKPLSLKDAILDKIALAIMLSIELLLKPITKK